MDVPQFDEPNNAQRKEPNVRKDKKITENIKNMLFCLITNHLHTKTNKQRDTSFAMLTSFIDYKHNKCVGEVAVATRLYTRGNTTPLPNGRLRCMQVKISYTNIFIN
jgi:hypothetical protein